ncbi:hypothetical protein V1514DRAFT_317139 [Lipomyces japonicus]|uniref:uncharacterized protein n=1 Tax=Lipomyces japonicus TaxID=56871 RepID=UPI0034CD67A0
MSLHFDFQNTFYKLFLQAVKFIHELGLAHGDISTNNVCLTSTRLAKLTKEEVFKIIGIPQTLPLIWLDKKPLDNSIPSHLIVAVNSKWVDL